MVAVKEMLKCQNCHNQLEDEEDAYGHRIICLACGREHDGKGRLIYHPIGGGFVERSDGRVNENYGARLA